MNRPLRRALAVLVSVATAAAVLAGTGTLGTVELAVATPVTGSLRVEVLRVPAREVQPTIARLNAAGASVGVNGPVRALADPRVDEQWGYQRLGGQVMLDAGATGEGVVVAVLDTGVDSAHPELAGRVLPGYDVLTGREITTAVDPGGHGTHVAGIIAAAATNGEGGAGLAPAVQILPVRVLDETGYGDDAGVAAGLVWAVDHGAQVVNMSLGTYDDNPAMRAAVEYATGKGVLVVASAGNDMAGGPTSYPAAYPDALAVAATTSGEQRAYFSTTGSYVDVAAPGQMILSTFPDGRYVTMSGTSMAAPFVSAAAAVVMQKSGVSALRAGQLLMQTALDLGAAGRDQEFGNGLISVTEASGVAGPQPPVQDTMPGMPGLPSLAPLPPLVGPSTPPLPALPALAPGALPTVPPSGPGRSPAPVPAPSLPAVPVPPPLPTPSGVPARAPASPSPALPVPGPELTAPGRPVTAPGLPARPQRTAVALSVGKDGSRWAARIQAAGPGSMNTTVQLVSESGRVLARGRTDAAGRAKLRVSGPAGAVVRALVGSGQSNAARLTR